MSTNPHPLAQIAEPDRHVLLEHWQQAIDAAPRVPDPQALWRTIGRRIVNGDDEHRHLAGVCAAICTNPQAAHARTDGERIVADVGCDHRRHCFTLQALLVPTVVILTADAFPMSHGDAARTQPIPRTEQTLQQLRRDHEALTGLSRAIAAGYAHPRQSAGPDTRTDGLSTATAGSLIACTAICDGHRPGLTLQLADTDALHVTDATSALARLVDQTCGLLLQPLIQRLMP